MLWWRSNLSYWVAVVARNAAERLPSTLDSVLHQASKPKRIIVVDDGSTDATAEILEHYTKQYSRMVSCLTLPDNGYDIRRVPRNINLAWKTAEENGLTTEYFMISGDDCSYQSNYASTLVDRMIAEPNVVVASGQPRSGANGALEHVPSGSGRMIRCSFWREVGGGYPFKAGWESWLLYRALEKAYQVKLYDEVAFEHMRPRGAKHQFIYWGAAMQTLGYHPLYAIGRIAKNTALHSISIKGSMNMLRGFIQAQLGSADVFISPFDSSLRNFVYREQVQWIKKRVAKLV